MTVKLLTEHHLEFLSLKGGCTGSSDSTLVKMSYCWKSHVLAHIFAGWDIFQTFVVVCNLFQNKLLQKILSVTLSECQIVWNQIKTDILSVLVWV